MTWPWVVVILFSLPCLLIAWGIYWQSYTERRKNSDELIGQQVVTELTNSDFSKINYRLGELEARLDDPIIGLEDRIKELEKGKDQ